MEEATFGELLKAFRKRTKKSQGALARALGKHRNTIGAWERGDCLPDAKGTVLEVAKQLRLNEHETRQLLEASLTALSSYWYIPFQRNPFFTGRDDVLLQLHYALGHEQTITLNQSFALSGLGGIGKTQTAIEYAYRYASEYTGIFWGNAETSQSLIASLVAIADLLQLPEKQEPEQDRIVTAVVRWFNSHSGWLLIFDNVEDIELVKSVLPSPRHGCLLFTSRRQAFGFSSHILDLEPMTQEEGMRFLLHRTRRLDTRMSFDQLSAEEVTCAQEIVLAMGGLPLALDQAGAYIEETGCSLAYYRTLYQTHYAVLLDQRGQWSKDHPHSVVRTLMLSIQQVEATCSAAADLLRLCAFLAPDAIPEELFLRKTDEDATPVLAHSVDALALNEALSILRRYSLLKRQAEDALLSIHHVVQEVLKAQMDQSTYSCWALKAIELVNYAFPAVETFTAWAQCQRLLPHALACATLINKTHVVSAEAGRLLHQTGAYLLEGAQYTQARDCLTRARAIREQLFGAEHPDVAESLNYEAELAYYQGQYQQAEQLHQRALYMRERLLGSTHPAVATSLHNLAGIYWIQGCYEQAKPLYQRALQLREEALGSNHLDVAETLQNLAYLFFEQGRYWEAEPLYQRALRICQEVLGFEHAYLVTLYNNMGRLAHAQGKLLGAKTHYLRAQALCERSLGVKHPRWAMTLSNLAAVASAEGEWEQAEEWYREALQIRTGALGPDNPRTGQSLYDLAVFYTERGRDTQAAHLYRSALVIYEKAFGPDHPDTARAQEGYTRLCARLSERERAQVLERNGTEQA